MTDLQSLVSRAISGEGSVEQRTYEALQAVALWYLRQGNFHDAYRLQDQNPEIAQEVS